MIGETSSNLGARAGPASTGKQRCWQQRVAASAASGGGSSKRDERAVGDFGDDVSADHRPRDRVVFPLAGAPVLRTRNGDPFAPSLSASTPISSAPQRRAAFATSRPPSSSSTSVAARARTGSVHSRDEPMPGCDGRTRGIGPKENSRTRRPRPRSARIPSGATNSSTGSILAAGECAVRRGGAAGAGTAPPAVSSVASRTQELRRQAVVLARIRQPRPPADPKRRTASAMVLARGARYG